LDLLPLGAAVTDGLAIGAGSRSLELIVFAASYGLLLLLLTTTVIIVSSHSRRLRQVSRHLRELSNVVQQQARAIKQLSNPPKSDLTPVCQESPPGDIAENEIAGMVQPADSPVDLQEQLKNLRELILKTANKNS
jgi:hypothetical protein